MVIKDDKIVSEKEDLIETFNKYYVNIVGIKSYNVAFENGESEETLE